MGSPDKGLFSRADLGYYSVGDRVFFHKYEAFEHALKVERRVRFHWFDEFWMAQDWTKEPIESLEDLYLKRWNQIRNKHGYIILCLSGGADSWNVLRVAEKHDIHIDEIVTYHDYGLSGSWDSAVSAEPIKIAWPAAQKYKEKHPLTTIRLIDSKEGLFDALANTTTDQLLHEYYGGVMSIGMPGRAYRFIYTDPYYRKLIESGKSVCLLKGWDKAMPTWNRDENSYSYWFNDHMTAESRKLAFHLDLPVEEEMFYWTPALPELLIKGCHVVKGRLDALPRDYKDPIKINLRSARRTYTVGRTGAVVSIPTVNSWLYPGWDVHTFTVGKDGGGDDFLSNKDFWVRDRLEEDLVKNWRKAYSYGWSLYQKCWETGRLGPVSSRRSTAMISRVYYL